MNGMADFYQIEGMSFRPELDYSTDEKRASKQFTIKKIPTINFKLEKLGYKEVRSRIIIICRFISFCYGIRVYPEKIIYYTDDKMFVYRDTEPDNKTYISKLNFIPSQFLNESCRVEKILKTQWFSFYSREEKKITKAINNYLHSREVSLGSSFLLLFNIIELFKVVSNNAKFKLKSKKKMNEVFQDVFEKIKIVLQDKEDEEDFRRKWEGIKGKLRYRPFKSIFEKTLSYYNINPEEYGYSISELKDTRDALTHGYDKLPNREIQLRVYCIRKIATILILSELGFKNEVNYSVH